MQPQSDILAALVKPSPTEPAQLRETAKSFEYVVQPIKSFAHLLAYSRQSTVSRCERSGRSNAALPADAPERGVGLAADVDAEELERDGEVHGRPACAYGKECSRSFSSVDEAMRAVHPRAFKSSPPPGDLTCQVAEGGGKVVHQHDVRAERRLGGAAHSEGRLPPGAGILSISSLRNSAAGACGCEGNGHERLPCFPGVVEAAGAGGEGGGCRDESLPPQTATPGTACDRSPSFQIPSGVRFGGGKSSGESEGLVSREVGGVSTLLGSVEDYGGSEQPAPDVGAAMPFAGDARVGGVGSCEGGGGESKGSGEGGGSGAGAGSSGGSACTVAGTAGVITTRRRGRPSWRPASTSSYVLSKSIVATPTALSSAAVSSLSQSSGSGRPRRRCQKHECADLKQALQAELAACLQKLRESMTAPATASRQTAAELAVACRQCESLRDELNQSVRRQYAI
eukprot:4323763-Pleurochrysis_carterae.AAC.2